MTNRTAIVTGGARGIGAAVSERFAADGMKVGIIDLNENDAKEVVDRIKRAGGEAMTVAADITDENASVQAVTEVAEKLGLLRSWSITQGF